MKNYAILARSLAGVMLIVVWGLTDAPLSGVALLLILTAVSAARYRIKAFRKWFSLSEVVICAAFALVWVPAFLGLWFPLIGLLENRWDEREKELLKQDYEDRAERLKLEKERETALQELQNTKRQTEINERTRIAQDIHDHVGHEVSGALLALQAAVKLYESENPKAAEGLLKQTVERLKSASENLREAVHNLKPVSISDNSSGLQALRELVDSFTFCETKLTVSANFDNAGCYNYTEIWELFSVNLKEALTNISRHSNATLVKVRLDQNADYIRMEIVDNGNNPNAANFRVGLGLSGMKERVRAAKGTLTAAYDDGFRIICVLPKPKKGDLTP